MAGVFVCLRIFPSATVLVAVLFVAACGAGVSTLNVESTGETHIPVVVVFNWIGRCAGRLKGRRRDTNRRRRNVERGGRGWWDNVLSCVAAPVASVASLPAPTPSSVPSLLVLLVWYRRSCRELLLSWR